ncbi:hypothetical protein D3C71_1363120 [compost metagenome]
MRLPRRASGRKQRGNGLPAAQIAAFARAAPVVEFAAAGTEFGEVDLACEHALLRWRQRIEKGTGVVHAAGKSIGLRQPKQQFGFIGLERLALVGQRQGGIGAARIEVVA